MSREEETSYIARLDHASRPVDNNRSRDISMSARLYEELVSEKYIVGLVSQFDVADEEIGASCTAQAIASSRHETQYTRIYRS